MKIQNVGEPIAQRTLTADNNAVVVTIGKPALYEDGPDYHCPYSIECFGEKKLSYAGGADAVQALQLAMKKIGVDLESLSRKRQVQISWFPDTPGETGFPT